MPKADKLIGTMACWSCAKEIPVKEKPSGKLSAACPWCDFPHYANEGTEHYRNLMADVKRVPELEAAPAPIGKNDKPAAPAAAAATRPASTRPAPAPAASSSAWASPLFGSSRARATVDETE